MRLIIFCGLPGTGKTTLAKQLSEELSAIYLRIDSIEQAMLRSSLDISDVQDAGYQTAYAIASDNLRAGKTVIVDAVNPLNTIRHAWAKIAENTGTIAEFVEVFCSDATEHQTREENRIADIDGHILPDWNAITTRPYEQWESSPIKIDTANYTIQESYETLKRFLKCV